MANGQRPSAGSLGAVGWIGLRGYEGAKQSEGSTLTELQGAVFAMTGYRSGFDGGENQFGNAATTFGGALVVKAAPKVANKVSKWLGLGDLFQGLPVGA